MTIVPPAAPDAQHPPRIGSLFSGYGGLDMGVTAALGGSVAWHVEFDKAPSKILAHHWPDVPNYGDVTTVDWSTVEPVDIITGGSPCQDLSHAGKRQGMTEGTRSNLWVAMREAIAQLRPGLVVQIAMLPTPVYSEARKANWEPSQKRVNGGHEVYLTNVLYDLAQGSLLPTPTTRDFKGHNQRGDTSCLTGALLPTPMVGSTSEASHGQISGDYRAKMTEALQNWGDYAGAIARWEALTRPAPPPTQPSKKGTPQLSPAFSEWLMGLPEGHITGVPGLSRNDMLKALGNGVVPQQAEAALRFLLGAQEVAA